MISLLSKDRLETLEFYAQRTDPLGGAVVEIGVYKGGSLKAIAESIQNKSRPIYGFDTFAGIPCSKEGLDAHKPGDFSDTSYELVKESLKEFDVRVHQGLFPDSFEEIIKEMPSVSFIHSDVDVYDSARATLDFAERKLVSDGVIVLDDYNWDGCKGVKKAVHEFLGTYPEKYVIEKIVTYQITLKRIKF